ncbi:hypothetical protein PAHAL_4G081200 [Panicum hallii]|uniref:Uncharacterized protein n=1 Tax=Panicum hallii TaxID=206008 RepID=A0A2T8JCA0_9POAL|nr:hypothetical protein PAHAL_4G081200 [Panicum hallii]
MQAIVVARARGLFADQENHQRFGYRQPGLPWDMGFTAVDVDRQLAGYCS